MSPPEDAAADEKRLHRARTVWMPWLASRIELRRARVLEIGCGTGAATLALAERGAAVTAVDVNRRHLAVARERCAEWQVVFLERNAADCPGGFAVAFDLVLFPASLEHMTVPERLATLRSSWRWLRDGGHLGSAMATLRGCRSSTGFPTSWRSTTPGAARARTTAPRGRPSVPPACPGGAAA